MSDWVYEVLEFTPPEVQLLFSRTSLPSARELASLPFHPEQAGVYLDVLRVKLASSVRKSRKQAALQRGATDALYVGCTYKRPVGVRKKEHENPANSPDSFYHQVKHDKALLKTSSFVSLLRVPIRLDMEQEEVTRRRVICRVGEAFFALWLDAFMEDAKNGIRTVSNLVLRRLYPSLPGVPWKGTCSHTPLVEVTGRGHTYTDELYGGRYKDFLEIWKMIYNAAGHCGDDLDPVVLKRLERKAKSDWPAAARYRSSKRDDALRAEQRVKARETRAGWSEETRRERNAYVMDWHWDKMARMTDEERKHFNAERRDAQRRHREKKRREIGREAYNAESRAYQQDYHARKRSGGS